MTAPLVIWLLNPYHTGSHRAWAEGYAAHSRHRVRVLSMAGCFWKWRMQGGALELASQAWALLAAGECPDLLLATSMVNVPALLALLRRELGSVPVILYMHENQLTYPPPPGSGRDLTYGMIQHLSMLAADRVCFNSRHHLDSWFEELPRLLKHFPDYTHLEAVQATRSRSLVLPVGCNLGRLDGPQGSRGAEEQRNGGDTPVPPVPTMPVGPGDTRGRGYKGPLVLWNQRWEYDKDPETMLRALYQLAGEGLQFRVALAGQNFRVTPGEFAEARSRLGDRLVHFGYAEAEPDYARLLHSADIVFSTAIHEFFGVSIVEAIYCGCLPVLPNRLTYPELIPSEMHDAYLYQDFPDLLVKLKAALAHPVAPPQLRETMARFDWSILAPIYDALMADTRRAIR